jgi:hypothetical protein
MAEDMTTARVRLFSAWTTVLLMGLIVLLTLFMSPAQGDSLSRMFPGTIPFIGSETDSYDTCLGGIDCQDGHALAFMALGGSLAVLVLAGRRGLSALLGAVCVLVVLGAFAAFDESAQSWTGRDASVDDWLADMSGAVLGVVIGFEVARFLVQAQPRR